MNVPDERRRVLGELLDSWGEFFFELADNGSVKGDDPDRAMGEDWTLFSSMSRWPAVVELRKCLALCERMGPSHHRHLMGFYNSEWRTIDRPIKKRNAHGKLVSDIARVRERVVPSWVVPRMVEHALDFLLGVWDTDVALELPPPLMKTLREYVNPDTGEVGWTQAA